MHQTRSHANGNLSSRANAFSVESLISPENTNQETLSTRMAASTGRGSPDNSEQGKFPRRSGGRTPAYFTIPSPTSPFLPALFLDLATEALGSMQAMQSRVGSEETLECEDITIELQMRDLWQRFFELGTEMIITKAGR